jgi:ankyrin repeat protein
MSVPPLPPSASSSPSTVILRLLLRMMTNEGSKDAAILEFGSVRNSHGDTPLMMAATLGNLAFLQCWYTEASSSSSSSSVVVADHTAATTQLHTILAMRNDSGDTCLTLATCHGHSGLVDFLLDECRISFVTKELVKCQAALQRWTKRSERSTILI